MIDYHLCQEKSNRNITPGFQQKLDEARGKLDNKPVQPKPGVKKKASPVKGGKKGGKKKGAQEEKTEEELEREAIRAKHDEEKRVR